MALALAAALPWWVPVVPRLFAGATAPVHLGPGPEAVARTPAGHPPTPVRTGSPSRPAGQASAGRSAAAGVPVRIAVPELGVDAAVVPVSGESGILVPPADPSWLGWWREGAQPGSARGNAVLTGHTVHTGGGALDHLGRLRPGDPVRVWTKHGRLRYVVEDVRVLRTRTLARRASRIFRTTGAPRLVLVTCTQWNGSTYLANAVVTARLA